MYTTEDSGLYLLAPHSNKPASATEGNILRPSNFQGLNFCAILQKMQKLHLLKQKNLSAFKIIMNNLPLNL